MLARSIDYENSIPKHLAWVLHSGIMGAMIAPMIYVGGPVLLRAACYTAGLVGGMAIPFIKNYYLRTFGIGYLCSF